MSEDVREANTETYPIFGVGVSNLEAVMQHLISNTVYTCLRGPRPSGAMLYVRMKNSDTIYPIYGHVLPPYGTESCEQLGKCMMENNHCVRCLHAEVAAILQAAMAGQSTMDGVMFSINKPCYNCTVHILKAGIKRIYYAYAVYDEDRTREVLEAIEMECIHVPIDEPLTVKVGGITVHDSASSPLIVKEITDLLGDALDG